MWTWSRQDGLARSYRGGETPDERARCGKSIPSPLDRRSSFPFWLTLITTARPRRFCRNSETIAHLPGTNGISTADRGAHCQRPQLRSWDWGRRCKRGRPQRHLDSAGLVGGSPRSPAEELEVSSGLEFRGILGFMYVCDVNGDGRPDIVSSMAHGYGIFWLEHTSDGKWVKHVIDDSWSQAHAVVMWIFRKTGNIGLLTGKRYMAPQRT